MRWPGLLTILGLVSLATGARGDLPAAPSLPSAALVDALTGIDFVAQRPALDPLLGANPGDVLASIAASEVVDPGVRLRALRAIALYPSAASRAALANEIALHSAAISGTELLHLRAAVEALGLIGQPEDVAAVVPMLDKEESRDVRAAAAYALRDIGSTAASNPLRIRLNKEKKEQVRFAISDALRVLAGRPQ
jgi:HEAT repeat protein